MNTAVLLPQHSEYTHKFNLTFGRHGWIRLTPAYSVKIVDELLSQYHRPLRIFDPFSGTATTALSAAYHRHEGITIDINPFLVWLGKAKTAQYSTEVIYATHHACIAAIKLVKQKALAPFPPPLMHNIGRWWRPNALGFLCRLRAAIDICAIPYSLEWDLLAIAFCRTLIALSNAAFNHQSMSFKSNSQESLPLSCDMYAEFSTHVNFILEGAADNPQGAAQVCLGDSRNPAAVVEGHFDRVITSPPYVNRMSYIRELRPYMYWLGFLVNGRDAGELDWSAIGGTWGIATSRLAEWRQGPGCFEHSILIDIIDHISHHDHKSGHLLARYVAKYFDDMWQHFHRLTSLLTRNAELYYIIGNSTFYGALLPTEKLYAAILERLGFTAIAYRPLRKRNSNKSLVEFAVTATWPG